MPEEVQSAHQEEQQRLEQTAAEIERQLRFYQSIPRYFGRDLTEQALNQMRETLKHNLSRSQSEPYFGRLDFQENGHEKPLPLYIGKIGIEDENTGEPLIVDWRAPVASLFYSFSGSDNNVSYEAPDGVISGSIDLKRNILIRNQQLIRVVEAYSKTSDTPNVNDEFLLYRLSETKDNRLRDIVSTIQQEQDRIIRSPKDLSLIIQGVAGSGKTTVALHRLAYLIYQYRDQIRAQNMIIFAPNQMFLTYISDVLPELGVGDIQQRTFTDWAMERLGPGFSLQDEGERFERWFETPIQEIESMSLDRIRFKGSLQFQSILKEYLDRFESQYVPHEDFIPWEGTKLSVSKILAWFYTEYKHYPIEKRKQRVLGRIGRWLEMELDSIRDPKRKKETKKLANNRLKAFMKRWPVQNPFTLFKQFLVDATETIPSEIRQRTMRQLRKKEIDLDDIAPLLMIHNRFYGIDSNDRFDHVVIDEAQDFSPFQVSILLEHTRNHSFTILGDLSQGIHYYHGIQSWSEFFQLFENDQQAYFQLEQSYRSTMEIIHFANSILAATVPNAILAQPVFRSGEKVRMQQVFTMDQMKNEVQQLIHAIQEQGNTNTIAVICRTQSECQEWYDYLQNNGTQVSLIDANQREYTGGISILPIYLSKGLEFDSVILVNTDAVNYPSSAFSAKLLYVGCTRALHHLSLFYSSPISPLLMNINQELYITEGIA